MRNIPNIDIYHCVIPKSSFWQSQGAMRFILLKRAMDLVYASIGTAIQVTGAESKSGMWMPVAAAAASYYAITGPDATASRVAQVMSSSSYDLIKRVSQYNLYIAHNLFSKLRLYEYFSKYITLTQHCFFI